MSRVCIYMLCATRKVMLISQVKYKAMTLVVPFLFLFVFHWWNASQRAQAYGIVDVSYIPAVFSAVYQTTLRLSSFYTDKSFHLLGYVCFCRFPILKYIIHPSNMSSITILPKIRWFGRPHHARSWISDFLAAEIEWELVRYILGALQLGLLWTPTVHYHQIKRLCCTLLWTLL